MQTQHHNRSKSAYHPSLASNKATSAKPAAAKPASVRAVAKVNSPARVQAQRFRIVKRRDGFRLNQVVHQFTGETYGIDVPGEVSVTVVPGVTPFIGLTPDYLERID